MNTSSASSDARSQIMPSTPVASSDTKKDAPERRGWLQRLPPLPRLSFHIPFRQVNTVRDFSDVDGNSRIPAKDASPEEESSEEKNSHSASERVNQEEDMEDENDRLGELPNVVFGSRTGATQRSLGTYKHKFRRTSPTGVVCSGNIANLRPMSPDSSAKIAASSSERRAERGGHQSSSLVLECSEFVNVMIDRMLSEETPAEPDASLPQASRLEPYPPALDGIWQSEDAPMNEEDEENAILFVQRGFLVNWDGTLFRLKTFHGRTMWNGNAMSLSPCGERLVLIFPSGQFTRYIRWPGSVSVFGGM